MARLTKDEREWMYQRVRRRLQTPPTADISWLSGIHDRTIYAIREGHIATYPQERTLFRLEAALDQREADHA